MGAQILIHEKGMAKDVNESNRNSGSAQIKMVQNSFLLESSQAFTRPKNISSTRAKSTPFFTFFKFAHGLTHVAHRIATYSYKRFIIIIIISFFGVFL